MKLSSAITVRVAAACLVFLLVIAALQAFSAEENLPITQNFKIEEPLDSTPIPRKQGGLEVLSVERDGRGRFGFNLEYQDLRLPVKCFSVRY